MTEEELFSLPLEEYLKARQERAAKHFKYLGIENQLSTGYIQLENSWLKQYIERRVK